MKVALLVKAVPYELKSNSKGGYLRENLVLAAGEQAAIENLNKLSEENDIKVDVITMGPPDAVEALYIAAATLNEGLVENLYILSDKRLAGADTYLTSKVLAAFLKDKNYDCVFMGAYTEDSATGFVPAQIAELIDFDIFSFVRKIENNKVEFGKELVYEASFIDKIVYSFLPGELQVPNLNYLNKLFEEIEVKMLTLDDIGLDNVSSLTNVEKVEKIKKVSKEGIVIKKEELEENIEKLAKKVLEV